MVSNPIEALSNIVSPTLNPILIGLGCQKKTSALTILTSLQTILIPYKGYCHTIAVPAFKQHDANIVQLQKSVSFPIFFIPKNTLENLQTQCQSFSKTAYRHTGLGSIAEACLYAIMKKKDRLLIHKIIYNEITVSLAYKGL